MEKKNKKILIGVITGSTIVLGICLFIIIANTTGLFKNKNQIKYPIINARYKISDDVFNLDEKIFNKDSCINIYSEEKINNNSYHLSFKQEVITYYVEFKNIELDFSYHSIGKEIKFLEEDRSYFIGKILINNAEQEYLFNYSEEKIYITFSSLELRFPKFIFSNYLE